MRAICKETEKGNDFVLKQIDYGGQKITSFTQPNSQILNNVLDSQARLVIHLRQKLAGNSKPKNTYINSSQ